MEPPQTNQATRTYWLVSLFLTLWGVAYAWLVSFAFFLATPQHYANLVATGRIKPEYTDYIANIPSWIKVLTVVTAITRLLGAIGLLLRRTWALPQYTVSFLGMAIIMFRGFFLANITQVIRRSQVFVEILFIAIGIFAVWFARAQKLLGILK